MGFRVLHLAYGFEAILPVIVEVPSHRRETYEPQVNRELLEEFLDLIEDMRVRSQLINAAYQQRMTRNFNRRVRDRQFTVGDLVLRRIFLVGFK